MKTSELTGAALDWAVAKAADYLRAGSSGYGVCIPEVGNVALPMKAWSPSTRWAQGGPIIEREGMRLEFHGDTWEAMMWWDDENGRGDIVRFGLTPLIAAMRCYVASKLGDDIDVPEELA